MEKICANCKHVYRIDADGRQYPRCAKSNASSRDDATLAGEMRQGECGPEATLWEAADGQA